MVCLQGKDLNMDIDSNSLRLIDPTDDSILNSQPIHSIRVWGVGRDNGRYSLHCLSSASFFFSLLFCLFVWLVGWMGFFVCVYDEHSEIIVFNVQELV